MKRILVVDDERQITRMLRAWRCRAAGMQRETAADGLEALAMFRARRLTW